MQVQAQQRLIAEQDCGIADQGLRDAQPLLLAAGQASDGSIRISGGIEAFQDAIDPLPDALRADRHAPPMAVQAKSHEIPPPDREIRVEGPLLRHVSDRGVSRPRGTPAHLNRTRAQRLEAEHHPQQRGLSHPIRADDGEKLSGRDRERHVGPDRPPTEAQRGPLEADGRGLAVDHFACPPNAVSSWAS